MRLRDVPGAIIDSLDWVFLVALVAFFAVLIVVGIAGGVSAVQVALLVVLALAAGLRWVQTSSLRDSLSRRR